jgi:hypothetical protein
VADHRKWKTNSGKLAKPRNPDKMLWLRFRGGWTSQEKRRAGNFRWDHRNEPGDIMEASEDD